MSLNSIDFMTMLPRTSNAADVQGREVSQTQSAASQTAIQFENRIQHEAQQTTETNKSETENYDRDGSSRGGTRNSSGKKKEKKKEAPMAPRSNSSFDIMI